jgi:hypothetical protein
MEQRRGRFMLISDRVIQDMKYMKNLNANAAKFRLNNRMSD